MSLQDLSNRLVGGSKGYISMVEHGKTDPTVASLIRIAAALGLPASRLLQDLEEP